MKLSFGLEKLINAGEKFIYWIIVILLFASAVLLILNELTILRNLPEAVSDIKIIIEIIAKTLLLLMIIEILSTVRISVTGHSLTAEPFLIVGLIASVRRILIISVETAYRPEHFEQFMIEIGVLSVLIFVFIISIVLLRKNKIN